VSWRDILAIVAAVFIGSFVLTRLSRGESLLRDAHGKPNVAAALAALLLGFGAVFLLIALLS
jgi:uncharacterized membrane protein YjjB (DUF3815 family)